MDLLRKKRGRPRKVRPEDVPDYWAKQLHHHRLGEHRAESKREIPACSFVNGKGKTVPLETIAAFHGVVAGYSGLESPSQEWLRSRELLRVILAILTCERKGGAYALAMRDELDDISPRIELPRFPEFWGTPEDLLRRWQNHEIGIRLKYNRKQPAIIFMEQSLPPDEPEDLD